MKVSAERIEATPKRLREIFDAVNSECFNGTLKLGRIGFKKLSSLAALIHYGDGRLPAIYIHSRLRWTLKLCCHELLHEMVHLANPEIQHGEAFELEIIKLKRVACLDGDAW